MTPSLLLARSLLFDLDGTLADTAPDIATAANRTMSTLGLRRRPLGDWRRWIGNGSVRLMKRALTGEWDGEPEPDLLGQAVTIFFEEYAKCLWDQSRLFPGVEETLAHFCQVGMSLGCVTNKPSRHTGLLLEASGLSRYISVWVGGDTLPVRKPNPEPLQHAAQTLGCPTSACVMVGDSLNDILAARAAGMPVIALTYGYHQGLDLRSSTPDRLLDFFGDLTLHLAPIPTVNCYRKISPNVC